jgi:hypothetical protein
MPTTTIVSAYMANVIKKEFMNKKETYKKYTEHFIPLLQAKVNKIIFIDDTIISEYQSYENEYTKIIPFKKESNYLYNYADKITDYQVNNNNPEKDTIEYMFTMCHKTEWVNKAIDLDESKSDQYIWMDFGIKHMCKCNNEEFIKIIENLAEKKYNKVRISTIWDLNTQHNVDIYRNITWYFAGSIFGGKRPFLIEFARTMKNICLDIIETKNTLMWEVNVWYLLYKKNPFLFDVYKCDHNKSIVENY